MRAVGSPPIVVLDDDATGVQTLAGIRVLLAWHADSVRAALDGRPAVHLITNTRALPPERVRPLVADAAWTARQAAPDARVVLRGDSTLRGHLLEEYLGVREVAAPGGWPVLLLVPALPAAGRVTVGGVHFFERDGVRSPLHETEYARDGVFAYRSARLLNWAEERSGGLFRAGEGRELPLEALRSGGPDAVAHALVGLAEAGRPVVFAPDAETEADLEVVAAGYEVAVDRGAAVIVRCAPTFAGVLAGTTATAPPHAPPPADSVLVVCGSYVPQTTRQLACLLDDSPGALVEADAVALAGEEADQEIYRLAGLTSRLLAATGLAVLATPRTRSDGTASLDAGDRIAVNLARVVAVLEPRPDVIVAKGGITSAVTLRTGVGAHEAEVLGPVEPGVSRWGVHWPDGKLLDYLVVPGNVGDDQLLARLVGSIARDGNRASAVP
ncbi:MAG: four-carbon acid sugar kinase family protein [Gaiella sp.]